MLRIVYTVHWIQPNKLSAIANNVNILICSQTEAQTQTQTEVKSLHSKLCFAKKIFFRKKCYQILPD